MIKNIQELKNIGEHVKIKIKKGATDLINKIKDNVEDVVVGGTIVALVGAITVASLSLGAHYKVSKNYTSADELSAFSESL